MQTGERSQKSHYKRWQFFIDDQIHRNWQDILTILVLAIAAGLASYSGAQLLDPIIFDNKTIDIWFESDLRRVFENMTIRGSDNYRTKVHPLFPLIAFPPVYLLTKIFNLEPLTSVQIVTAVVASLWIAALFILLRLIGCRRLDATLFSLLGATSAAAVFWFTVPETYSFGSLTILLALCFVTLTQYSHFSPLWYIVVSTMTASMTLTNWMVGILATAVERSWKRFLTITFSALLLLLGLWGVQNVLFPSAKIPFYQSQEEFNYVLKPESGGPLQILKSFISHTMVMPAIEIADHARRSDFPRMLTQPSSPGSGSLWGSVAVGLWLALLGVGLWGLFSLKQHPKLRLVLGLTLLGQLALHLLYGDETFLYSLHFLPLLIVLAALSTLTRARWLALGLASLLLLPMAINNVLQFQQATAYFLHHAPVRYQVRYQMRSRPSEPWPRGIGHVVLATPGSREEDKAYHEPGGSFSPAVGSFGVSIWMVNEQGDAIATSDTIPLSQIQQQLSNEGKISGILTKTDYYEASWSSNGLQGWKLHLKTSETPTAKPIIVIRSVGPAGGAIQSLDWNGQRLQINDRWSVKLNPAPVGVDLGQEGTPGWINERSRLTQWQGDEGWGYARFELADGKEWNLTLEDLTPPTKANLSFSQTKSKLVLDFPDRRFADSLNAQVSHLMMGLVGQQTRPGEPTNYPLPWLRDGAYTVVALARAGQLEVAKQLSTYFAQNDFFGGFGPEADAPGLALWTLEEVAKLVNDPEYDRWLWPHVRRKAELIVKMLESDRSIHQPVTAPIVPGVKNDPELTLVAEAAKDGLIVGRMDHHRPLLFVNAVSYRGLLDAASLGDRLNQSADALRWRTKAAELQKAWEKAFQPPESDNERTYISSLWPTWIATAQKDALLQKLQDRWNKLRDAQGAFQAVPLWTYFDLAEAHQWLYLDKPERSWATVEWFWQHQASPGLYTWWEGKGEENSSGRWENVRGWVDPPHVTPHYWTAAEMLLLQLDMLAYCDRTNSEPTLVIGSGISKEWLDKPMKVEGLSMPNGRVDWLWDGKQMRVQIRGSQINVKLGAIFPKNTPLEVEYFI